MRTFNPQQMDVEERRRALRLAIEKHKSDAKVHISNAKLDIKRGRVGVQFKNGVRLGDSVRGYSHPAAVADAVRKAILAQAMREDYRQEEARNCVVLVKDGKLTEEGIKRGIKL